MIKNPTLTVAHTGLFSLLHFLPKSHRTILFSPFLPHTRLLSSRQNTGKVTRRIESRVGRNGKREEKYKGKWTWLPIYWSEYLMSPNCILRTMCKALKRQHSNFKYTIWSPLLEDRVEWTGWMLSRAEEGRLKENTSWVRGSASLLHRWGAGQADPWWSEKVVGTLHSRRNVAAT